MFKDLYKTKLTKISTIWRRYQTLWVYRIMYIKLPGKYGKLFRNWETENTYYWDQEVVKDIELKRKHYQIYLNSNKINVRMNRKWKQQQWGKIGGKRMNEIPHVNTYFGWSSESWQPLNYQRSKQNQRFDLFNKTKRINL